MTKAENIDYMLSVVMPIYNEEDTLEAILDKVLAVDVPKEIVCVNDCSHDRSVEILEKYAEKHKNIRIFHHEKNMGKGAALQTGFANVEGDFVVVQDADLEYDPNEYHLLLEPLLHGKADVVYGSRFLMLEKTKTPLREVPMLSHYFGNKFLNILTGILYFCNITDMETCYKTFRTTVLKEIKLKSRKFDVEPEITAKLRRKGHKIHEVPISYYGRGFEEGKKITWKDGFAAIWALLKFRFFN